MSTQRNREAAHQTMSALDRRNLQGVVATYAPDATFHGWAPTTLDCDGYLQMMGGLLEAFPDSRFPVDDVVAEGDRVVVRHRFQGTHRSPFQGVPASGAHVEVGGIAIFRYDEQGQVAEAWLNADFLGILQQIGAIPAPAS